MEVHCLYPMQDGIFSKSLYFFFTPNPTQRPSGRHS